VCSIDWKLVIDGIAAAATVAVAGLAIWGDWFRARFAPPRIELRLHTLHGVEVLMSDGSMARYYHLKAVNVSPLTVEDCRILLRGLHRREGDGKWIEVPFIVPFPFIWSGEEPGPELVTITTERVFDLGALVGNRERFVPRLRAQPINFDGYVRKGQAMRYELAVDARSYWSAKPQTFEVSWDGEFPLVSVPGAPKAP
jgi:hypothetical protein